MIKKSYARTQCLHGCRNFSAFCAAQKNFKHMKQLLILLWFSLLVSFSFAQVDLLPDHLNFDPELTYDPNIPSPETHLGYQLGEHFTLYAHVVDYFKTLEQTSDKLILNKYGETYEGRSLYNVVITSSENQGKLEQIRQAHLALVGNTTTNAYQQVDISKQPVFTSMSYNIHGNEASSTEAVMQVAYRLVAAQDATTKNILDNSVIILYLCINPDGRDRYVYWYKTVERNQPGIAPEDLEHFAPWPNGRTNHYWFDLNRDWIWGVHPESRGHTAEYQRWMPQVHVDYHEQGYNSNYFTMPGTTPRNKLLPDNYEALSDTFGMANVAAFDRHQLNYFTREAFDFFYPGYGSSYPSTMGAIGMLTEQGGIGAGRAIRTEDDFVLTLRQRVFDHYTTSLATIAKAVEHRRLLLEYSRTAWNAAKKKTKTEAYFLPADQGGYIEAVIQMLMQQGVEVRTATSDFKVPVAKSYRNASPSSQSFEEGTYIISTDQPRHLFISSVLDRNLMIEDSVMYDMATWSAPLAYNLDAWYTERAITVPSKELETPPVLKGELRNSEALYAYVIDWNQRHAPKALAKLWEKGYNVRAAQLSFTINSKDYPPGSLIILKGRNRSKLDQISADMQTIAAETQVVIDGLNTGRASEGIDLASRDSRPVKQPRVALLVEPPFSTYTSGQIYFLFDQYTALPVDRIRTSVLQQTSLPKFGRRYGYVNLWDYDVLILPGGGRGLKAMFEKESLEELRNWVADGGVLVATESAAPFFTDQESGMTEVQLHEVEQDSSDAAAYLSFEDREDFYGKKRIPGSALNAKIDVTNPLAFGLKPDLYSLKFGNLALVPDPDLQTVGYYYKDQENLLVAGYASEENLAHLAGHTFAGVLPIGNGKVVFLMDNTQYRMFWLGPSRMMQNAVMLLPGM